MVNLKTIITVALVTLVSVVPLSNSYPLPVPPGGTSCELELGHFNLAANRLNLPVKFTCIGKPGVRAEIEVQIWQWPSGGNFTSGTEIGYKLFRTRTIYGVRNLNFGTPCRVVGGSKQKVNNFGTHVSLHLYDGRDSSRSDYFINKEKFRCSGTKFTH